MSTRRLMIAVAVLGACLAILRARPVLGSVAIGMSISGVITIREAHRARSNGRATTRSDLIVFFFALSTAMLVVSIWTGMTLDRIMSPPIP
jgi:hypothetical protein